MPKKLNHRKPTKRHNKHSGFFSRKHKALFNILAIFIGIAIIFGIVWLTSTLNEQLAYEFTNPIESFSIFGRQFSILTLAMWIVTIILGVFSFIFFQFRMHKKKVTIKKIPLNNHKTAKKAMSKLSRITKHNKIAARATVNHYKRKWLFVQIIPAILLLALFGTTGFLLSKPSEAVALFETYVNSNSLEVNGRLDLTFDNSVPALNVPCNKVEVFVANSSMISVRKNDAKRSNGVSICWLDLVAKSPGTTYFKIRYKSSGSNKYGPWITTNVKVLSAITIISNGNVFGQIGKNHSPGFSLRPSSIRYRNHFSYSSSNPNVAKVDRQGYVQGVGYGTTTITAKHRKDAKIKASYTFSIVRVSAVTWKGWGGVSLTNNWVSKKDMVTKNSPLGLNNLFGTSPQHANKTTLQYSVLGTTKNFSISNGSLTVKGSTVGSNDGIKACATDGSGKCLQVRVNADCGALKNSKCTLKFKKW